MDHPFQRWVDLARPSAQLWRLVLGVAIIGMAWTAWTVVLFLGAVVGMGVTSPDAVRAAMGVGEARLGPVETFAALGVTFATFWGLWFGAWAAMRLVHRQPFSTLLGFDGRARGGQFLTGVLLAAGYLGVNFVALALSGVAVWRSSVPMETWLAALAPMAVLLFFQSAGEELVFRGYVLQRLAARAPHPLVWGFLPSFAFGLLHLPNGGGDPQFTAYYVFATTMMGLVMAALVWRTGTLWAAMGFHTMNNIGALLVVSVSGSAPASLFVVDQRDMMMAAPVDLLLLGLLLAFVLSPLAPLPRGQPLRRNVTRAAP